MTVGKPNSDADLPPEDESSEEFAPAPIAEVACAAPL